MNVTFFEAKNHSSVKSKGCGYAGICKINRQPDAKLTVMGRRLLSQQVRNEWVLLTFMDVTKNGKDSSVSPGVTW